MMRDAVLRALRVPLYLVDRVVWAVREHAVRSRLGRVGRNFVFDPVSSKFVTPELLQVGDDVFLNAHAHLSGDIVLGDRLLAGPGVKLLSGNHLYGVPGFHARDLRAGESNPEMVLPLRIEADVWIGANAIVLGGVTVGTGSVLGAGAVASRDIPPFVVAAGSPARAVRRIFDDATLARHLHAIGLDEAAARAIIARRAAAGADALPLATPAVPARFLHRGTWTSVGDLP